uniref:Uncharacterized protein n=1 Tax=Tanacetum cinerariifolium TaxID=118510 RepID=A0A699KYE4_TANCI|nr:hypothetical protein [Tanacetum cinerariifolium]
MALTFENTHNMIAFLTKSDASEGFNEIIDFLNASSFKKKVVITEATIRDALRLDDAEGIECLPNVEIFIDILQCMRAKRTSWNEFSSSMASAVICLSIGKGCSGVETPLFKGMIVAQQVGEGASKVHVKEVSTAGVAAEVQPTPPPSPIAQPPSPPHQTQPSQDTRISMDLLLNLMDTCTTLTRRVEHLEQDKIAQALEITKLKQRVKKLERKNKASKLRRLKKVGTFQMVETSDDTVMDDVSKQGRIIVNMDADKDVAVVAKDVQDAKIEESLDVHGRQAES